MEKQKYILFSLLKLLVVSLALWYIYRETVLNKNFEEAKRTIQGVVYSPKSSFYFIMTFILMFFNWGFESLKWKMLIKKTENISFGNSIKAVLSGLTVSVFTPNRTGEFLGRVFYLNKGDKVKGALISLIGSMSQFLVTIVCGSVSLLFFILNYQPEYYLNKYVFAMLVFLVFITIIFSILLFFSSPALSGFSERFRILKKHKKYFSVFSEYSQGELFVILLLSFCRYFIFTLQFYFLLKCFSVEIYFADAWVLVPLIFLAVTVVPTITPAEIGVREFFALQFIGVVSSNSVGIVLATFSLWVINLAIPAFAGSVFVLGIKWSRK